LQKHGVHCEDSHGYYFKQTAAADLENARIKKERLEKQMRLAQERKNRPKKAIAPIGKGIAVNTCMLYLLWNRQGHYLSTYVQLHR
jgi:hypothetical protein